VLYTKLKGYYKMDLENIISVVNASRAMDVNNLLNKGWILLHVGTVKNPDIGVSELIYSLGWDKTNGVIPSPDSDEVLD
jgi:hypothetical protein